MSTHHVKHLLAIAVATGWGLWAAQSVVASTMPPPDEPAEFSADSAPPAGMGDAESQPAEPAASEASESAPSASAEDADAGMAPDTASDEVSAPVEAAPGTLRVPSDGIRANVTVLGEVVGHSTGKVLFAANDEITLRLYRSADPKPHDRYAIARRAQFVEHPDSGRNMGYVIRIVGTVELEQAFGRYWSGRILSSADYVTVDDWLIPFEPAATPSGTQVAPDLTGHIVAVQDELVLNGEANVVYTDLGSEQGVRPGTEFVIIRPGTSGRRGFPDRRVGALRVLAVHPASSTAYITQSTEPIEIGYRLQLQASPSEIQ